MDVIQLDVEGIRVALARELERQDGRVAGGDNGVGALDVLVPGVGVVEGVKVVKVDSVEADEDVALVEGEVLALGDVVPVAEVVGGAGDEAGDGLGDAGLLVALGPADEAVDMLVFCTSEEQGGKLTQTCHQSGWVGSWSRRRHQTWP
jgi:hypothetical protein